MTVYSFKVKDSRGNDKVLGDYRGKVLLIVNVASKCGSTPQYAGFQQLYDAWHERGWKSWPFPAISSAIRSRGLMRRFNSFAS